MKIDKRLNQYLLSMIKSVEEELSNDDILGAFNKLCNDALYMGDMNYFIQLLVDAGIDIFCIEDLPLISDDFSDVDFHNEPIICNRKRIQGRPFASAKGVQKIIIKKSVQTLSPNFFDIDFYSNDNVEIHYEGSKERFMNMLNSYDPYKPDAVKKYLDVMELFNVKIIFGE